MIKNKLKPYFRLKYLPTWLLLGMLRLTACLPYRWQMSIGSGVGILSYYLARSRRHIADVNLKLCFPDWSEEKRSLCLKDNFRSVGQGVIEMGMAWWSPSRKFAHLAKFSGEHYIAEAQKSGRGVLLVGGHFTTLDLAGRMLSDHYHVCVTYRQSKNKLINAVMTAARAKHYELSIDRDDVRQLVRALKEGRTVWLAPDQDYGHKVSVFAPFFGIPAATLTATARLARMTGAVLLPARQYRLPNGEGYSLEVGAPLIDFPTADEVADAITINKIIEEGILKDPTQYLWQHRRFKTRPEGCARPY